MDKADCRTRWREYCKAQNISLTGKRIFIDGLSGMAQGLFASLLIGCIINTIGCITGWLAPSERAMTVGESMGVDLAAAYANPTVQWIGLGLICFVIPAAVSWLVSELMRKKGWISLGDYKLDL